MKFEVRLKLLVWRCMQADVASAKEADESVPFRRKSTVTGSETVRPALLAPNCTVRRIRLTVFLAVIPIARAVSGC